MRGSLLKYFDLVILKLILGYFLSIIWIFYEKLKYKLILVGS